MKVSRFAVIYQLPSNLNVCVCVQIDRMDIFSLTLGACARVTVVVCLSVTTLASCYIPHL